MKTIILVGLMISGFAQAAEFECIYQRETPRGPERHSFFLTESKNEEVKNLRGHGVRVKIENGSFVVEAREGEKTKVSSIVVKDAWGEKRHPKVLGISLSVSEVEIKVGCR